MLRLDLKIAVRTLLHSPGFTLTAVLTMGLAIALATSVFAIVNAVLVRPLPYKNADRLAMIWSTSDGARGPVSFEDFEDWRRDSKTIQSAAVFTAYYKPILTGAGQAERIPALLVSHQYFTVLGVQPALGRFFRPEEDRDGRDDVVVLSNRLWRERFHADPQIVGRSILLNARPHTIVGVAPADLPLLPASLAEQPAQIYRSVGVEFGPGARDGRSLETIVRLRAGVSIEQAQAELDLRCRDMQRRYPADGHLSARIVGLREDMTRSVRSGLLALQGAVLVLMLIACANIANLLLAKSSARSRELAVRAALGASAGRLIRLLLSESVVLGLAGGALGVLLAAWSTAALTTIAARVLPDAGKIEIDGVVLAFAVAASLMASVLFGLAPAFRLSSGRLDEALRHGSRVAGDQRHYLRELLAASQIALALLLLVSAGLLARSFLRLRAFDPGFEPRNVLSASVALPGVRYPSEPAVIQFFDRALRQVRALPGVREAAIASVVPMSGDFDRTGLVIYGQNHERGELTLPDRYIVSPEYFRTLRIPLRQGRLFDAHDAAGQTPVCIISETAARQWFPGASPLGQKVRAGSASGDFDHSPFREVVGVVGDIAQYGLGLPRTPQIYMPYTQFPRRFESFVVRTQADPAALGPALQQAVFAADPEQPIYDIVPLEHLVSNSIAARRLGLWLLAIFAAGALALAALGIYGVVSYSVVQRTAEFGIRVALGAQPGDILRQAFLRSARMIGAGLLAGLAASLAISKVLAGFLYGIQATDAATFSVLPLFLALVAAAACYLPARRATKLDPLVALRHE